MSQQDQNHMWQLAGRYSAIGIEMAVALTLPVLVSIWLDKRFDTAPWCFIGGVVVGIGAAANTVIRVVRHTKLNKL